MLIIRLTYRFYERTVISMPKIKDPEFYIQQYEKMYGELPPDIGIRDDSNDRLNAIIEAIDSGKKIPPADPLDARIDY